MLSITDRYLDAVQVMNLLNCTDVTARKYMKILIEKNMVHVSQTKSPFNGHPTLLIKSNKVEITDELLNSLQSHKPTNGLKKYHEKAVGHAEESEFGKNGVYKMMTRPSKSIEEKMRETQAYDRKLRKSSKIYASGSSLSAVMLSANY